MKPLEAPPGAFTLPCVPTPDDIDENGHVNNVVYLRWAQDIAIAHWRSRVPPEEVAKQAWVVLRHEVDYRRPLMLGETATARTWVGEASGPRFIRHVRIDAPDGTMSAQTVSTWCLLDPATKRPTRIPAWMIQMFADERAAMGLAEPSAD
ncbi:MAG: thioesterase [Caulobacterales bacterium 68-7]|nr:MAG: thioesterase [Caulobacterales bacterium 68-7]